MGRATLPLQTGVVLLVLALSGCTSTKTATTETQPATSTATRTTAPSRPAGSTVVTDDVNRFSVTLPPGYTRITDKAQLEAIMKAGGRADPKYKAILDQYAAVGDRARIYAIKLGDTDFADNLNIIVDTADGMDADHIADLYDGVVKPVLEGKLGATITGHRLETVAGTKALRVEYRAKFAGKSFRGTQVYLVA